VSSESSDMHDSEDSIDAILYFHELAKAQDKAQEEAQEKEMKRVTYF